jgi:hypothetical protein
MSEENGQDMNRLVSDSEHPAQNTPVLATLVYETPMGGTINPENRLEDEVVQEAPKGQTIIYNKDSMGETLAQKPLNGSVADETPALLKGEDVEQFRAHWSELQGSFVDEPRLAVEQADALVREVIEKIAQLFASEHDLLENQWKQGGDVSTEDLRKTLQRYHAFFNRLVVHIPDQV